MKRPIERYEMEAWLGDDHGLSDRQVDELAKVSDEIYARHCTPDAGVKDPEMLERDLAQVSERERDAELYSAYQLVKATGSTEKPVVRWLWLSPRGFANEGRVLAVPEDKADDADLTLSRVYGGDVSARYFWLGGKDARQKATRKYANWAHTEGFELRDGTDPLADTIEASAWLWDGSA